jgi:hypothetical protein
LDKTINDSTIGILGLNNDDVLSGSSVNNVQREINKSSRTKSLAFYLDNDTITLNAISQNQIIKLSGNSAPITLNNLTFSNQPLDGTRILLIGQDDTNTVTINLNDVQFGQYINGDAELKRGYILELIYDSDLERFLEIGRNF